ncbi:hypothetical protein HOE39_00455 [Candidatus Woesearchaeota archaeon]|nr:hypothetical protein [Candidatus Woesearchaeota archaeon]
MNFNKYIPYAVLSAIILAFLVMVPITPTGDFKAAGDFTQDGGGDTLSVDISQHIRIDTDGDGILDVDDVCPYDYDPGQMDFNNDGIGDMCQDSDGDGLTDYIELNAKFYPLTCTLDTSIQIIGTDPTLTDSDGDGISDPNDEYPLTRIPNDRVNNIAQNNYP